MPSNSGRELVYCHACADEWYRDEHGLVCPRPTCGSDAVEIIEGDNDPRRERGGFRFGHGFDMSEDNDEGGHDHSAFFRISGPNFSFTTTQRSFGHPRDPPPPPRLPGNDPAGRNPTGHNPTGPNPTGPDDPTPLATEDMVNMFANIVRTLVGDPATPPGQPPNPTSGGESPQQPGAGGHDRGHPHGLGHPHFGPFGPMGLGERFFYDSGARLNPRDADSPQPPGEARVVDLTTILGLFTSPPGGSGGEAREGNGQSPGSLFARLMGLAPGAEGDFVYSQAQLDRVISQLMEQHQGNAPPPASREDIEALPKIKVTKRMALNGDDCAVCKEDLVVEEEVTKLPCSHYYHFDCVSKWLEAHNTCPICRHPITPDNQRQQQPPNQQQQQQRSTLWPFNTTPTSPYRDPQPASRSSLPEDRGGGGGGGDSGNGGGGGDTPSSSSRGGGLSGFFRRHNGDRPN